MTSLDQDSAKRRKLEQQATALWQVQALRAGCLRSCLNCDNYTHDKREGCKLADGSRPPAIVIVLGCDSWVPEIPF
jgi:hypothetical protein